MSVLVDLWYLYHPPLPQLLVCFQYPYLWETGSAWGLIPLPLTTLNSELPSKENNFEAVTLTYCLLYHRHLE